MASLDKLEGDAIEAVGVVILIIVVLVILFAWKELGSLEKFLQSLEKAFQEAIDSFKKALKKAEDFAKDTWNRAKDGAVGNIGEMPGYGPDVVATGTSTGTDYQPSNLSAADWDRLNAEMALGNYAEYDAIFGQTG